MKAGGRLMKEMPLKIFNQVLKQAESLVTGKR